MYNGKYYDKLDKPDIHGLIWDFYERNGIMPHWKSTTSDEMARAMKANSQTAKVINLDDHGTLLNLNNCVFDIEAQTPHDHDPKYYFSYALTVDYKPEDEHNHPNFTLFLSGLFRTKDGEDQDTMHLMFYIIAYLLYPEIKMEKIFIFYGGGSNGKSVLIDIIKMFFPERYVTAMSLNIIANDESFNRNPLQYSRLNISAEQNAKKGIESAEVKKCCSGDSIQLRGLHKEAIKVNPKAKYLLATNEYVYFKDQTEAMIRRLLQIEFKNSFKSAEDYKKEEQYGDPAQRGIYRTSHKDELISLIKQEKSAIFNTLILYLQKLKELGWILPETENTKTLEKEFLKETDKLGTWLRDNYKISSNANNSNSTAGFPSTIDILNEFKTYYDVEVPGGKAKYSTQKIGLKIKQEFHVEGSRINRNVLAGGQNKQMRVTVYPIQLKDDIPEQTNEITLDDSQQTQEQLEAFKT